MKFTVRRSLFLIVSSCALLLAVPPTPLGSGGPPEHFENDPSLINPDPNYVPGDYPAPETYLAKTFYEQSKSELIAKDGPGLAGKLFTIDLGEISFSAAKNKTLTVIGNFRNYFGVVQMGPGGFEKMEMVIDINSLDTAIPARDNRILDIFFTSGEVDLGMAAATFDRFEFKGEGLETLGESGERFLRATGQLALNRVSRPIAADLVLEKRDGTWIVRTAQPISLKISDFGFGGRVYALMKECNHKSLGNEITVKVELFFR